MSADPEQEYIMTINEYEEDLIKSIASLMDDPTDADFVIKCADREWKVHKAIISNASPTLSKMCHSELKEGQSGVAEIVEFSADTVQFMLEYIYKRDYGLLNNNRPSTESTKPAGDDEGTDGNPVDSPVANLNDKLLAHIEVVGIADFCQINLLKDLAVKKFDAVSEQGWSADGFVDVVKAVELRNGAVDRELRDALQRFAAKYCTEITENEKLMASLAGTPEAQTFLADLCREVVSLRATETEALKGALAMADVSNTQLHSHLEQLRGATTNLIGGLEGLPASCPHHACARSYAGLSFAPSVHTSNGRDVACWEVRCACNARLMR